MLWQTEGHLVASAESHLQSLRDILYSQHVFTALTIGAQPRLRLWLS